MIDRVAVVEGCWIWTALVDRDGYGRCWDGRRFIAAHRFAYMVFLGPIPEGMVLDHLCGVRPCVNPCHLEAVTSRVNTMRGTSFAAFNAAKTHCVNDHPFSPENTYVDARHRRICRACGRDRARNKSGPSVAAEGPLQTSA